MGRNMKKAVIRNYPELRKIEIQFPRSLPDDDWEYFLDLINIHYKKEIDDSIIFEGKNQSDS